MKIKTDLAWWLKPVIPALWEAEVGGSRGQEIETTPANTGENLCLLKKIQKNSRTWCRGPVVPATREAEAGEWHEPRRRSLQRAEIYYYCALAWATEQDSISKKKKKSTYQRKKE